jgi:hypothetical protein
MHSSNAVSLPIFGATFIASQEELVRIHYTPNSTTDLRRAQLKARDFLASKMHPWPPVRGSLEAACMQNDYIRVFLADLDGVVEIAVTGAGCGIRQKGDSAERVPSQSTRSGPSILARAAIARANKIARMAWAMMARGERYREPVALAA